jgi:predicted outer membrane repeat protein
VALYGGFEGTETVAEERDWGANETILSGDIGVPADSTDNSYHVVVGSGTDSTAVLDGFTITAGAAADDTLGGGGMIIWPGSPTISNTVFSGNTASTGGGLYARGEGSRPTLVNVTFTGNSANDSGGGLTNDDSSKVMVVNAVFSGNSAGNAGGAMHSQRHAGATLTNVTFSGNTAGAGGAISNDESLLSLINTILWGNTAALGSEIWNHPAGMPVISYSLIESSGGSGGGWNAALGTDGGDNIDADPSFVDQASGNLRLTSGSPAIDAGTAAAPDLPETDRDGNSRISGFSVDMGAYESALVVTGIEEHDRLQPFRIVSAAPNPFNPSTTIHFTLPNAMPVTAEVWSVTGALVRVLATNKPSPAGDNELVWAGRNDNGSPVASGVYFIRIATGLGSRTARVVLLK